MSRRAIRAALAALSLCLTTSLSSPALADPPEAKPHGAIPFKQEKESAGTLAYQSFAGLVLAGLAAYGAALALRRFGGRVGLPLRQNRRVHTVEAIRLSRRSMLYVVEYRGRELLLAENEHGVQLLASHPLETQPNAGGSRDDA